MTSRVLSRDLNQLVLAMAPAYVAQPMAPQSLQELLQADRSAPLPVWDGASEGTIYGDPRVNHAFRAWHDACHVARGFSFDLQGEIAACRYQIETLRRRFPSVPQRICRYIEAEIIGQAAHYAEHGTFPADQFAFFEEYACNAL